MSILRTVNRAARAGKRFTLQPVASSITRGFTLPGFEEYVKELIAESEANIRLRLAQVDAKDTREIRRVIRANAKAHLGTIKATAQHAARMAEVWQVAHEFEDLLWGFRYITKLDDKVRDDHIKLDGLELPKDHPFWETGMPPNGWGCRCRVIALTSKPRSIRAVPKIKIEDRFSFNPGTQLTAS